ncbi:MAG TPA: hypothetical protein VGP36_21190 [Mycobacteriales bacterium]|nr:hypothetical protein [Mycobacteriales bacterium]
MFCTALVAATGAVGADASIGLGTVVSTNPVNYTPNVTNGAVYKTAEINGMLYAGGSFTSVAAAAGTSPQGTFGRAHIVAFNAATGSVSTAFAPNVNGAVWAIVAGGSSLYVGGSFSSVNGVARRGIVKLDPVTGAVDSAFNAKLSGNVSEAAVVNGRLIVSGTFAKKIAALNLTTGADTGYITVPITGSVAPNAGAVEVYRFAVNPAGTRLVGIGNFTAVGGQTHYRALMLTLGATSATVNAWRYKPLEVACSAPKLPDQTRDVDFSPDGSYFVIVATGGTPSRGQGAVGICDAAARFETDVVAPAKPTWINYTGGDTLHSVAVSDKAVYVQGHQRWLDNPQGHDNPGPGAVARQGIGAIDPVSGKALPWNPGKDRGVGGRDLLITPRGLWVSSDTAHIGGETRMRVALLPV